MSTDVWDGRHRDMAMRRELEHHRRITNTGKYVSHRHKDGMDHMHWISDFNDEYMRGHVAMSSKSKVAHPR
jgi:hypothetical protein